MDISEIIAEHGAVYKAGSASMTDLRTKYVQKSESQAFFPTFPTDSTILDGGRAEFSNVIQRFQTAWTPKGGVTITPEKVQLYEIKIDFQELPDKIEASWLGFLADKELDRTKWPIVKWLCEGLLEKSDEDMELYEIYGGVPAVITPGTATPAGGSMMGIKKLINTAITAGKCVPISMGAVPTGEVAFVDYVEDFVDQIPEILRSQIDYIFMSKTLQQRFQRGMRTKYNVNYAQVTDLLLVQDTKIQVAGLASHTGSNKIWATPRNNRIRPIKKPKNPKIFKIENVDRLVKCYTDWWEAVGFWCYAYLFTNDVELT